MHTRECGFELPRWARRIVQKYSFVIVPAIWATGRNQSYSLWSSLCRNKSVTLKEEKLMDVVKSCNWTHLSEYRVSKVNLKAFVAKVVIRKDRGTLYLIKLALRH